MSLQYHLLAVTALNDYAYHLAIVFYSFRIDVFSPSPSLSGKKKGNM